MQKYLYKGLSTKKCVIITYNIIQTRNKSVIFYWVCWKLLKLTLELELKIIKVIIYLLSVGIHENRSWGEMVRERKIERSEREVC